MSEKDEQKEDEVFVSRIGPVEIDWPRSLGYFGGVGLAIALDLVAPPLALFVAAVPFLKLLKHKHAPLVQRAIAATLEGMAKPIGGDSQGTIRLADDEAAGGEGRDAPPAEARAPRAARASTSAARARHRRARRVVHQRPNGDSSKWRSRSAASS